jgi:DNA-binding transcriptional ArsR family regulator
MKNRELLMKNKTATIQIEEERCLTKNTEQSVQYTATSTKDHVVELARRVPDPNAKRLFWYLFAGTAGGETRSKIIMLLRERPYNTNQLAEKLGLDYKAIQHHIRVLENNNLITRQGVRYGVMFFISPYLDAKFDAFDEICNEIGKNK